ncbi:MAG: YciI family protein [Acidobacteriaceae bacterium]|nr:YciI family protein [Acidobacteriaceae bacterium]MBV9780117.1 YciI family protein [Acidobacteriaceae bacterium]
MQYLLLIYEDEKRWANFNSPELQREIQSYRAFGQEFTGAIKGGNALQPTRTAKTVRVRDDKPLVTDGPFAETKEQLGGYYLIDADSPDQAAAIAAKIPSARFGSVEVRPIQKYS